jgi:carbon monoxide dehydrogenase subunit G
VKSELSSGTHKSTLRVDDTDHQASPLSIEIDGTGAYDAGFADGEAQFTLFPRYGYEVTNWQQYGNNLYVQSGSMYINVGSGFVQVNSIGDVYTKAE